MTIEGDVNAASTTNEALTSHPPSTTEASDDEFGEEAIDVTAGEE
ncbi:hypothetical protein H5410_030117 [Solanum commersonii]|uniref:Uncharacterized protein n=1 Tax=Solanum commersonii TaxID=4109 RepID=A0A9J5YDC6_SOLCO|nr:hypothetical protein H5410_030117 [Solanum commersonii]